MSPGSPSGIASFSFSVPASQPVTTSSGTKPTPTETGQPPSDLMLRSAGSSGTVPVSERDCIATLPTMLLHLIKTWLIDKESLPLILTGKRMNHEVQHYYHLRLRPTVAAGTASPIAACQNSANLRPSLIPLGQAGEALYQQCMAMKTPGLPDTEYCSKVIQLLNAQVFDKNDVHPVGDTYAGATLGLGGTFMSAASRDALMAQILGSYKTSSPAQMGAMIRGVCVGLRRPVTSLSHHEGVLGQILASGQTSTPSQMGNMIGAMCRLFGNEKMSSRPRTMLISKILVAHNTLNREQIIAMLHHVCLALGGPTMKPEHRDGLITQILTMYGKHRQLPQAPMIQGLCRGFGGMQMTDAHRDALLAALLGCLPDWNHREIAMAMASLCIELGGRNLSPHHRDAVLARILAAPVTCGADTIGRMVWSLCRSLCSYVQGATDILPDNLDAIVRQVIQWHGSTNSLHPAAAIFYIYDSVGKTNISPVHRDILVTRLRESSRLPDIVASLKFTPEGQELVTFLQLEGG